MPRLRLPDHAEEIFGELTRMPSRSNGSPTTKLAARPSDVMLLKSVVLDSF
jgi:hypothetical protein